MHKLTRIAVALLILIPAIGIGQDHQSDAALKHAKDPPRESPLIDGYNDLPWLIREETGGDVAAFQLERGMTLTPIFPDCGKV